MDSLAVIFVLFVLGTLALYFLQVAKNVAYILFVLILGWGMLHYVGPYFIGENQTIGEALIALNDRYQDQIEQNLSQDRAPNSVEDFFSQNLNIIFSGTGGWNTWEKNSIMGYELQSPDLLHGSAPTNQSLFLQFIINNFEYSLRQFLDQ